MPLFLPPYESRLRHEVLLVQQAVRVYTVGEVFLPETMQVYHNGRRLKQAADGTPITGEYVMAESGGSGSGYDTIYIIGFTPSATSSLFADYAVP